jgi:hypothetical protein
MITLKTIEKYDQVIFRTYEFTDEVLENWGVTKAQVEAFISDQDSVDEDVYDIILDMIGTEDEVNSHEVCEPHDVLFEGA